MGVSRYLFRARLVEHLSTTRGVVQTCRLHSRLGMRRRRCHEPLVPMAESLLADCLAARPCGYRNVDTIWETQRPCRTSTTSPVSCGGTPPTGPTAPRCAPRTRC